MIKVLYINHKKILDYWNHLDDTDKKKYLDQLAPCYRSRILDSEAVPENPDKKHIQALASGILMQRVFGSRKAGTPGMESPKSIIEYPEIILQEHGRPVMPSESLHFSISHSFDYTIMALADQPVGADIEKIRPVKYRMAIVKRMFPECYQNQYEETAAKAPEEADTVCMKLWTCLEAILKAEGTGFTADIRELEAAGVFDTKWKTSTQKMDDYFITLALPAEQTTEPEAQTSGTASKHEGGDIPMQEVEPISRRDKAMENFLKGYNCSQSTVLAFSDLLPIDEETLMKLTCSFGGGMGRLREVCGAFSGTSMIIGLLYGYSGPETGTLKNDQYARIQHLAAEFEKKNGSIICRELLGLDIKHDVPQAAARTAEYYQKRPCGEIIGNAAENLEKYILLS